MRTNDVAYKDPEVRKRHDQLVIALARRWIFRTWLAMWLPGVVFLVVVSVGEPGSGVIDWLSMVGFLSLLWGFACILPFAILGMVIFNLADRRVRMRGLAIDPRCPHCEYSLRGGTAGKCPECGEAVDG